MLQIFQISCYRNTKIMYIAILEHISFSFSKQLDCMIFINKALKKLSILFLRIQNKFVNYYRITKHLRYFQTFEAFSISYSFSLKRKQVYKDFFTYHLWNIKDKIQIRLSTSRNKNHWITICFRLTEKHTFK